MTALSAQGYGFPEFHPIVWSVPCFGYQKSTRPACQHHDELALLLGLFVPCISANCNQTRHRPLKRQDHDLEPVAAGRSIDVGTGDRCQWRPTWCSRWA